MRRLEIRPESNIVLIGMPGVGKSTVGVLLAKDTSRAFLDTDVVIQSRESRRLWEIQRECGMDAFVVLEEKHILRINARGHVIATGGSVVFSDRAMRHLAEQGPVVHLHLRPEALRERLGDLEERGVVMRPGQTLNQLYAHRLPYYQRYADLQVECENKTMDVIVREVTTRLQA